MSNKKTKKSTIDAINVMIEHADQGPSGFWTDDYEGCGNPLIFPEFAEGLKHGKLVQKEHYLCPWNTAVIYGDGHGDIHTGCYHSCSIDKARYLTEQELKQILIRFKMRLSNGDYDNIDHVKPLLSAKECKIIEERILTEKSEKERYDELKRKERLKESAYLVSKYPDKKDLLASCYGEDQLAMEEGGVILFHKDSRLKVVGAERLSYNEYLDIQFASLGQPYRSCFAKCFFNISLGFKGQIQKINSKYVCFKRIFISGMYPDGEMFEGKEDHVWLDISGFENFVVGDCVSFTAEVYRYIKTGNGKLIDYGLRNPEYIHKIEDYELPSDDELLLQDIDQMICESCFWNEQCYRNYCMKDEKTIDSLRETLFHAIKSKNDKYEGINE